MSNTPEIAKLNSELYSLLRTRGYKPATVDSQNQRVPTPEEADVIEFEFIKDGESYGKVWATVEDGNSIKIYYDNTQPSSPKGKTPGLDYDDSWTGFLKHLKNWSTKRQLNFDLLNKDRLNDDMKQREYYRKEALEEGYYPINKSTSWNDSVPQVKLIIHHKNPMADGDKRHKNIDRIFIQNNDEERFLLPTRRPGIARVYARHVAKGGLPNDERWNHIKDMCDEYNKIGGFVRATRGKQYEESVMELVEEGRNHFKKCRENLMKISKTRGYDDYFENDYMEMVNETECDESLLEKFDHHPKVKESLGIISRLNEKVKSMKELRELEEWAESIVESSDDTCECCGNKIVNGKCGCGPECKHCGGKHPVKEEQLDESIEFHVRLDHLDGSDKIDDVIEILKKYEEGGKINYEAETDKGVIFNADNNLDVRSLDRELRPYYTGAEINEDKQLDEAEYQGKKVQLNKPKRGGSKKYYVYVKNPKTGNVKKISFGDKGLRTKSGSKGRAKSFAARHQCEKKNDKMTAGYWACRLPRYGLVKGGKWW